MDLAVENDLTWNVLFPLLDSYLLELSLGEFLSFMRNLLTPPLL